MRPFHSANGDGDNMPLGLNETPTAVYWFCILEYSILIFSSSLWHTKCLEKFIKPQTNKISFPA